MEWDRVQAHKAICRDYPDMPADWCKMVLDYVLDHPGDTADILSGTKIVPPPKDRNNKIILSDSI